MMKKSSCPNSQPIRVRGLIFLGVLIIFALVGSSVLSAPDELAYVRKVRAIDPQKLGVTNPVGLAFSQKANALLLIEGEQTKAPSLGRCEVVLISLLRDPMGSLSVATGIPDPLNVTFSPCADSLIVLDKAAGKLIKIGATPDGRLDSSQKAVTSYDIKRFPIQNPQGITSDPETGDLYVLDSHGPQILRIIPGPEQDFDRATIEWIPTPALRLAGSIWPGRIAFSPANRHLYLFNPVDQKLFELAGTGGVASVRDLSSFNLTGAQAMVFAPSGDQTDEPSVMSLYFADSGHDAVSGQSHGRLIELSLTAPVLSGSILAAVAVTGSLANTIDTTLWSPPSPDPSGLAYDPATGTILVSDSEVEKTGVWSGVNMFEMTLSGSLLSTYSTMDFSSEPTGMAYDPSNGHWLISDDDWKRVFEVDLGPDGTFGTSDDVMSYVDTKSFGSYDPEGVSFDGNDRILFIADGDNAEVYLVTPGPDGIFEGAPPAGDDEVTHFDTAVLGLTDLEGIEYNPHTGTLYLANAIGKEIVETKLDGTVVRIIDISGAAPVAPAGIAYGPASANPHHKGIYVADRGIDQGVDPNENDGKIFEFSITWPEIYTFSPTRGPEGTKVRIRASQIEDATEVDFNGVPADFTMAEDTSDTSLIATVPAGAATGPISMTTPGGTATSVRDFTVTLPPTVTSITPATMKSASRVTVTVAGSDFVSGAALSFENGTGPVPTASRLKLLDSGHISARITVKAGGPSGNRVWDVVVTNPDGGRGVLVGGFIVTKS